MKEKFQTFVKHFLILLLALSSIVSDGGVSRAASRKIPPFILLTKYSETMNIGDRHYIGAIVSDGRYPKWTSSNSRVASVDTYGVVTAKKAGKARIRAKVSGAEATCTITVNKTTISLNKSSVSLEHGETFHLRAKTSDGSDVTYRSKRPSIATITEDGFICGEKPGSASIVVKANSTTKTFKVKVKKPTIKLAKTKLTLKEDEEYRLSATTSSGLEVTWKSSKPSVVDVDNEGYVYAGKKGTARICATLDGVKKYCNIKVTK